LRSGGTKYPAGTKFRKELGFFTYHELWAIGLKQTRTGAHANLDKGKKSPSNF